jgi:hypothetical protein
LPGLSSSPFSTRRATAAQLLPNLIDPERTVIVKKGAEAPLIKY